MITKLDIIGTLEHYPIRQQPRYDDELIFAFVRSLSCDICGQEPPSTVSHVIGKGRAGNNASAIWTMPKCMECHQEYQSMSLAEFEAKHGGINMRILAILSMERTFKYLSSLAMGNDVIAKREKKINAYKKKIATEFKRSKLNPEFYYCPACKFMSKQGDKERHKKGCRLVNT